MSAQSQNLNQAILDAMDRYAERVCFRIKQGLHYKDIKYRRLRTSSLRLAVFFQQQGITKGERIVIVAHNSLEWMAAHMACLFCGGVVVPLQISLTSEMLHFILQDCGASIVMVENEKQSQLIEEVRDDLPELRTVVVRSEIENPSAIALPIPTILGDPLSSEEEKTVETLAGDIESEALATIFYTAGEAGRPKGAVFNQTQRLQTWQYMAEWFELNDDDLAFTLLPWGHPGSLNAALHYFLSGVANVLAENAGTVQENMQQTSPTVTLNNPYFMERFYDTIMDSVAQMPKTSQEVFHWAVGKAKELKAAGKDASAELRQEYARADLTFFSQIRGSVGGRLRRLYSVGAPLPQELGEFFGAIGLLSLNVYSVTEAGGFPAVNQPADHRPDCCGRVAPGFEIRIADDGEVLVKSPTIMQGYWQRPAEAQQIIDTDGWLHTGDLGHIDQDGYLYLTDRKEALVVLSTGRKVMPSRIEKALMDSPFVAQAVVFGESRPYVSALIVPDLEVLASDFQEEFTDEDEAISPPPGPDALKWFWQLENQEGVSLTSMAHPKIKARLDKLLADVNSRLDGWEQIRAYNLLEQAHSKAANELVELITTNRNRIAELYINQIESMYPQTRQIEEREITRVQMNPERLRALLEKESILDAWLADAGIEFLFELAREKQIDAPSMVHLCDTAASIAQMVNEGKPLSTALIVGDPVRIGRILPPSQIQLLRHDHIRRMRHNLVTLATMVDGLVLGFAVDKHGYLRGIHKVDVNLEEQPSTLLLGPQFRRHASISGTCDAIVFFVPAGGKQVRVFANGELAGRYSNGDWAPESMYRVGNRMAKVIEQKNYDVSLIQRVLRCAFQMSERNLGAIFVVGNADKILEHSDAPEISHFAWIANADLATVTDEELINFAKQDGATVIDAQGKFRGCMVLLRPGADTEAEIGPGKGARHSSAAKMSAEAQCLAIAISQDGPISIYESGRRILSL